MTHRAFIRTALFGLVIALTLAACSSGPGKAPAAPVAPEPAQPDPPSQPLTWPEIISDYRVAEAVYALGFSFPDGGGYFIGTGFAAYYDNALWTNAHVAVGLRDLLPAIAHLNPTPIAVRSGTPVGGAGTYRLIEYEVHPEYGDFFSPDLASIIIDGELPVLLELMPEEDVTLLQVAEQIATMGFPGELNQLYRSAPIASYKQGTISALRPYGSATPTATNTRIIQHNLNTTGGTSGSPIIDRWGFVVAVNFGSIVKTIDPGTGRPIPDASGNLNFGVRVDEVWTMIEMFETTERGALLRVATAAPVE